MAAFQLSRRRLSNVLLHSWGKHCEPLLLNIIGEPTYLEQRVNAEVKHKHGNRIALFPWKNSQVPPPGGGRWKQEIQN